MFIPVCIWVNTLTYLKIKILFWCFHVHLLNCSLVLLKILRPLFLFITFNYFHICLSVSEENILEKQLNMRLKTEKVWRSFWESFHSTVKQTTNNVNCNSKTFSFPFSRWKRKIFLLIFDIFYHSFPPFIKF